MRPWIKKYLKSLDIDTSIRDLSLVQQLQEAHLENFIFSSLNVLLKQDLSLDEEVLFQRLIDKKMGGYCFEHNKILYEVLKDLGFDVRPLLGRVLNNQNIEVPRTHRTTLLRYDDRDYIVDVGFSYTSPTTPIPLDGEIIDSSLEKPYRIQQQNGTYFLEQKYGEHFFTYYSFDLQEAFEADFEMGHFYSHRYPQANFVNNLVASRIFKDKILSLRNDTLHIITKEGEERQKIHSSGELQKLLEKEFLYILNHKDGDYLFERFCQK